MRQAYLGDTHCHAANKRQTLNGIALDDCRLYKALTVERTLSPIRVGLALSVESPFPAAHPSL